MKSKRITMYVCEKCGWEYRNKEDCAEHEKIHGRKVKIVKERIS